MASAKEFDLCVFGASGFTGRFVALEVALQAKIHGLRIAFAGRSTARLNPVVLEAKETSGFTGSIAVIEADVGSSDSLTAMARASHVVLNCVGPFRFFGEQVVTACIAGKANYVDITGEPEFMEKVELKHHEAAKAAGVLIVSSCGFDSIPADMGVIFATDTLRKAGHLPTFVESFLNLHTGPPGLAGHYATYESAVHGFGSADELRGIRKQYISSHKDAIVPTYGVVKTRKSQFFWAPETAHWAIPFMGSDASVVRRTQRALLQEPEASTGALPIAYNAFATINTTYGLVLVMFYGIIFSLLASFAWGRSILLRFPKLFSHGIFSHSGPTDAQLKNTSFSIRFFARGYSPALTPAVVAAPRLNTRSADVIALPKPDVECEVEVAGPEPGYVATSRMLTAAALSLLQDRSSIPIVGGVFTPGAAFRQTKLVDRLAARGITFTVKNAPRIAAVRAEGSGGANKSE